MDYDYNEGEGAGLATMQEAVREWAWGYGAERPGQAWLLSDLDTWERNPHYTGQPEPHPEDDRGECLEVSIDIAAPSAHDFEDVPW